MGCLSVCGLLLYPARGHIYLWLLKELIYHPYKHMDNCVVIKSFSKGQEYMNSFFFIVEDNKQSMSFLNGKTISKQATGWKLSRVQHHLDDVVS